MMSSRGLFGGSPPHIHPLTPVSEVSEPPESPSPYLAAAAAAAAEASGDVSEEPPFDDAEEIEEPPPATVPFSRLFACADNLDWVLIAVGSAVAAAHGMALVVYLHFFGKAVNLLGLDYHGDELFHKFKERFHAEFLLEKGRLQ